MWQCVRNAAACDAQCSCLRDPGVAVDGGGEGGSLPIGSGLPVRASEKARARTQQSWAGYAAALAEENSRHCALGAQNDKEIVI